MKKLPLGVLEIVYITFFQGGQQDFHPVFYFKGSDLFLGFLMHIFTLFFFSKSIPWPAGSSLWPLPTSLQRSSATAADWAHESTCGEAEGRAAEIKNAMVPKGSDTFLGGGFKYYYFHPYLGKIPILTNIFQWGWNHQLVSIDRISQS